MVNSLPHSMMHHTIGAHTSGSSFTQFIKHMKLLVRKSLSVWLTVVIGWQVASVLFTMVGISYFKSMSSMVGLEITEQNAAMITYIDSYYPYLESSLFGLFFGTLFYLIYWLTENTTLRRKTIGKIIMVHCISYILAFAVVFMIIGYFVVQLKFFPVKDYEHFIELVSNNYSVLVSFIIYIFVVIIVINSFLEIRKKFGPGNLWKLLAGRYHVPVSENRIFMFLDLKDSTGYAEQLGHIKYSQLIQDCFLYLNNIVDDYDAQIYQYVGDEAVLTWDMDDKSSIENSISLFFAYQGLLKSKEHKFIGKYGFLPEFKAGINEGRVTAAEIGNIKREIAYHGDVLNTGARIQSICNEFKKNLLVSEVFAKRMNGISKYRKEFIGNLNLKGKSHSIDVFSVEPAA